MQYIKVVVGIVPYNHDAADLLQAQMGDLGYESFVDTDEGFEAYIQDNLFDKEQLSTLDPYMDVRLTYDVCEVENRDWNAEWEKTFRCVEIGNRCRIRSPFHGEDEQVDYDIVVSPRMSFGTGHHETTRLMLNWILEHDMSGRNVLDMGCGTGVLGILSVMRGCRGCMWVDFDNWAVENTIENLSLNNMSDHSTDVFCGGAEVLPVQKRKFDVVLANINRNVLVENMSAYEIGRASCRERA